MLLWLKVLNFCEIPYVKVLLAVSGKRIRHIDLKIIFAWRFRIITDIGLESAEDSVLACPWQQRQVSKLHSTSIESERLFHSVVSKYAK